MRYKNSLWSLTLLFILVLSCKPETDLSVKNLSQKSDSIIKINLEVDTVNTPLRRTLKPFRFLIEDTIDFSGVPDLDTLSIQYLQLISPKKIAKWQEVGLINKNTALKERIYAVSGFKGDNQIVILDSNFNNDFSDDIAVSFDKKTRYQYKSNLEKRDSLTSFLIRNIGFENKKPTAITLYLKALPFNNYSNDDIDREKDLSLVAEEKQYYKGVFTVDSTDFKIVIDDGLFGDDILIEPINNAFKLKKDPDFFTYRLKDTLPLASKYYRIDSISPFYQTAFLKILDIKEKQYGFRKGYRLKDFDIQPIDSVHQTGIKQLLAHKPYLLLDFWGTWCVPCVELTPDLVSIHTSYRDHLNIVSIAVEPKLNKVKQYVKKNQLNWYHYHIKMNPKNAQEKSQLLEDLVIRSYPTFILVDQNQNILYWGSGRALPAIKKLLNERIK